MFSWFKRRLAVTQALTDDLVGMVGAGLVFDAFFQKEGIEVKWERSLLDDAVRVAVHMLNLPLRRAGINWRSLANGPGVHNVAASILLLVVCDHISRVAGVRFETLATKAAVGPFFDSEGDAADRFMERAGTFFNAASKDAATRVVIMRAGQAVATWLNAPGGSVQVDLLRQAYDELVESLAQELTSIGLSPDKPFPPV